ncbi:AraC family transcriptional regulator [Paenibacillus sp. BIHB 4019]|uniref:AraC family transcriptional regulator n=1 Tax=Paenibacillus sp. BIHB 4019 TaxID=1870819 RepID=A0A1B2DG54_9BACL|nr:AraC family transcriptional regulator [Paenibacillus sp. BIHB 4019]ANY66649.1 AraC family transcriptional regulator [Paenibacillus sp. BIHB 4019]
MIDVDELAEMFAGGSYDIAEVHRFVIQPGNVLRGYKTMKHGLLFPVRGEARIRVDNATYDLQAGSIFHSPPNKLLHAHVTSQSEYEYYTVLYRFNNLYDTDSPSTFDTHFRLEPGVHSRIHEHLAMLLHHMHSTGGIGKLRVKELFLGIMHQVFVGCKHRESGGSDYPPDKKAIEEAVSYINGHYMDPLTLDELSELHAMSPKRFSYFFHKYTGFRPIDYVIHYRMERASELLKIGEFPIGDIAGSVGYSNPLYFSRIFKKKFGLSPSAYSQKQEHENL